MKRKDELPSLNKLQEDIKAMRLLSIFMPREKRQEFKILQESVQNMISQIDNFNSRFSDLGWCAYDSISRTLVEEVNATYESNGVEIAEEVLINYYHNDIKNTLH